LRRDDASIFVVGIAGHRWRRQRWWCDVEGVATTTAGGGGGNSDVVGRR